MITPVWPTFLQLLNSYHAIGRHIPVTFEHWLVMNGIKSPAEQQLYLTLFHWSLHTTDFDGRP